MPEQPNIEWKSTWKDEYLKRICGFANAQGGWLCRGVDDWECTNGMRAIKRDDYRMVEL